MATLGKNLLANYIGRSWTAILAVVLVPVYIRYIGIESYGLVGFFTTLTSVIGILDLGIGSTLNRELAKRSAKDNSAVSQRDLVRTLELIYWSIALIAGCLIISSAGLIAGKWLNSEMLDEQSVLTSIRLMGLAIIFRFPASLYQGGLMGLQKQILLNKLLIINGSIRGLGAVLIIAIISPSIEAFFTWQLAISVYDSLILRYFLWKSLPKCAQNSRFRAAIIKDIWKYAAAISGNAMVGVIMSQLDKIILSKMLTLKLFAYYSIATTAASSIWMLIIPFNTALFPKLVQLFESNKKKELTSLFHIASQTLSLILLPISSILFFYSRDILNIWLNNAELVENSYLILSLLVLAITLNGIVSLPANSTNAFGWPMLVTYTNLFQAFIIIPLIIFLTSKYGGIGAAIASICLNSTYIAIMTPFFFKRFLTTEKKQWYIFDILLPTSVTFLIGYASILLKPTSLNQINIVLWIFLTFIVAFLAAVLSLNEIKPIFRAKFLNIVSSYGK